jgi:CRP-like cAMP-binding protein
MGEWLRTSFQGGAILGHLSYVFLILSMLMGKVVLLRLFALAAGLTGVVYFWVFLGDRVASVWEVLFIAANLFQVCLTAYRNRTARFDEDETFFRQSAVPGLPPADIRRLLGACGPKQADAGVTLIRENEVVGELIFIVSGDVEITVAGKPVAHCVRGQFIGEISVSNGGPATATAVAATPLRYLAFDAEAFRRVTSKHRHIGKEMELAFRSGLREKLVRTNAALAAQAAA